MRLCVLYIVSVLFFASCKHKDNNSLELLTLLGQKIKHKKLTFVKV